MSLTPSAVQAARAIASALHLARPLVVLDTETTGVNVEQDRVIELGLVRIAPDGETVSQRWLINPGMPIPPSATAIHHITDADVSGCPTFATLAPTIAASLTGCDLAGYNAIKFDVRILQAEFARAGVPWPCADARVIDPYVIFTRMEPRDLAGAVRFYLDREHGADEAHTALGDVLATIDVLAEQLSDPCRVGAGYPLDVVPRDLAELHTFCEHRDPSWIDATGKLAWRDSKPILMVGKYSGTPLQVVVASDSGYLRWMLGKDFPQDTKDIITAALKGRFPAAPVTESRIRPMPTTHYKCPECQDTSTSDAGITPHCVGCGEDMVITGAELPGEPATPPAPEPEIATAEASINVDAYVTGMEKITAALKEVRRYEFDYNLANDKAKAIKKQLDAAQGLLLSVIDRVNDKLHEKPLPLFAAADHHTDQELLSLLEQASFSITLKDVAAWTDEMKAAARAFALAAHSERPTLPPAFLWSLVGQDEPPVVDGETADEHAKRVMSELGMAAPPADAPDPVAVEVGHRYPKKGKKKNRKAPAEPVAETCEHGTDIGETCELCDGDVPAKPADDDPQPEADPVH